MELVVLVAVLLAGLGLLGVIAVRERPRRSLQTVELRFGMDVTAEAVQAMLGCIGGLPSNAVVVFDVVAGEDGIRHLLHAPQQTLDTLRGQWRGVLPSLRLDAPADIPPVEWSGGALVRLSGSHPLLRVDGAAEAAAALLGVMQPLSGGEQLLVRWVLGAGRRRSLPQPASRRDANGAEANLAHLLPHESVPQADHLRALRAKYAGPMISGIGIVAAAAGHPKRASHLLSRVVSAMRSRGSAYGQITVRRRGHKRLVRLLDRQAIGRPDLYTPAELVGLSALPVGSPQVPGLTLGTAPVLMPSLCIPRTGRVLAVSTWPGMDRRLAQPVLGGMSHTLCVGPTGVGKSALICNLIVQDLEAGRGCLLVDGKGDLAQDILARIPSHRRDVLVLDPGAGGPQPGLRLFGQGTDPHLTTDLILGVLAAVAPGEWGPMSAKWLRAGLLLLAHAKDAATLADLPFVFTNDGFRRRLVARLDDRLARETWAAYSEMKVSERAHQLAAPLNKLDEIIGRRVIRAIVGQTPGTSKLDMGEVLSAGQVVVVSLSPGQIGLAGRLLGALVVHQFFQAVQSRVSISPEARQPFYAYVDEPKVMGDIPVPLDSLYELARGMNVGVALSAQSLAQLPTDLRAAVTTNSSTLIAFRQNAADSKLLAPELTNVSSESLQHLGKYEVVMRIGLGPGDVSAPVSGRTIAPPAPTSDPEEVRRASAASYGTDPAKVEAALAERHRMTSSQDTPVGFLRRQP
jgi:hypothetical protein